jgi:hypothetical protein
MPSVVVGYVVKGAEWHPSPRLQELARARARAHLDRTLDRLSLSIHGEPSEKTEDDGWGGILLTLTARGRPA